MANRTKAQRTQLKGVNAKHLHKTRQYAYHMRPFLLEWEASGLTQRQIVHELKEAGAVVPSEYTSAKTQPQPIKKWSLVQYQRFRKEADVAYEKMHWWAKSRGRKNVPFGGAAGLFQNPRAVGLDPWVNKQRDLSRLTVAEFSALQERRLAAFQAEQAEKMKDPVYRAVQEQLDKEIEERADRFENGTATEEDRINVHAAGNNPQLPPITEEEIETA
jgi:hypothetical protein